MKNEFREIPAAFATLDRMGITWVVLSCVVGVSISYCGIWAQSLISATSFLVLVNTNKFVIIFIEAYVFVVYLQNRVGFCFTYYLFPTHERIHSSSGFFCLLGWEEIKLHQLPKSLYLEARAFLENSTVKS